MDRVDCVVVGAGVVGLAIAAELASAGLETIVLEREAHIGTATSSRNSEVIHAGIYYPPGSLKARLCVQGRHLLYQYCEQRGIAHRRCGKLIVASSADELTGLSKLHAQAQRNGVDDLQLLDQAQTLALEPKLACVASLLSPSTGIIDSHQFMLSLQGDLESQGGMVALNSPLRQVRANAHDFVVTAGEPSMQIGCRYLINSAGLQASQVAAQMDGLAPAHVPPTYLAKGNYFSLTGRSPFSRLIYPAPEAAGLGVHLTLDLGGQSRFGPDVQWIDTIDYEVAPNRADVFYGAIRRYWPELPDGALQPAYAGIRPKLQTPSGAVRDFMIQTEQVHGIAGLVNLFGIESPGLTASLAIAQQVREQLGIVAGS